MSRKKVIGYIRISTKEQSNYSLKGQEDSIRAHCDRNDWDLLNLYKEDGESASNFDRPNWKELERFLKANHKNIDYLVVYRYDRFSRDLRQALNVIEKFEQDYNIKVLSVQEHFGLHPKSPMFFQMRSQILLGAQMELMVLKERTKFGLVSGAKAGRFLHPAPVGYKNARDKQGKGIIIVDQEKRHLIKSAFDMFLDGMTQEEIRRQLQPLGLNMRGNGSITRLLKNPVYAGLVKVNAYYDDPEQLVEGIHEPIIEKSVYWRAQGLMHHHNRVVYNDEVPLRGVLRCHCGRVLTAGNSKGKTQYYWYYKCSVCKQNLSGSLLHQQMGDIMAELSFSAGQLDYIAKHLRKEIEKVLSESHAGIKAKERELIDINAQLEATELKFISNQLDPGTYNKWKTRFEMQRYDLLAALEVLNTPQEETWNLYYASLEKLQHIDKLYNEFDIHAKQSFLKLGFNSTLWYEGKSYRTHYLHPLFGMKAAPLKKKGLLFVEQPKVISGSFAFSSEEET